MGDRGNRLSLAEIANLQAIEGAPLSDEDAAMLRMFQREGWSPDQQADYIRRLHAVPEPTVVE